MTNRVSVPIQMVCAMYLHSGANADAFETPVQTCGKVERCDVR